MMKQITPILIDAAKQSSREMMRYWLENRAARRSLEPIITIIQPTKKDAYPYCRITSQVVTAYRYVTRISRRHDLQGLYIDLAGQCVGEAIRIIHGLPGTPENGKIMSRLHSTEVALMHFLDYKDVDPLARDLWQVSDMALNMAEAIND